MHYQEKNKKSAIEGKEGKHFNLVLECASLGSLGDRIADYSRCFKGLPEADRKVVPKIVDFGLAKRVGKKVKKDAKHLRGTALYVAPESIVYNEYEPHTDVWALGCVVLEMLTVRKAWNWGPEEPLSSLLDRIGYSDELPLIPEKLSLEAQDFVNKCLVKNTTYSMES
ncbi:Mitogen-activated protein kinase kinase kinase protein [Thalictrum thalictroides]|uniref:Mitogen-activated protein kinase kinase kinase protein n=1 Tax=Thalictrum thalictroides TaxID=46969 RepID=A0A7J6W9H4_THATH|nr:Mitogen-activated protein kinase kinase kinase protein [Thalictrum thalictroides]